MTQYAALIYSKDVDWTQPEYGKEMAEYGEFSETAKDVIRGGAALYQTSTATTVRVKGGKGGELVTSDGPYAETKEALMGFYLLEAPNLDAAVAIARDIPGAWQGAVEVRPVLHHGG